MKKLVVLLLVLVSFLSFSQERKYSFDYRENRTPTGWEKVEISGDVIFHETKYTNTITIVTPDRYEIFYVKSRQLFIKQEVFLITLVDDFWRESSIRLVVKGTLDTVDLYFYSDRVEDKYYRLILKKCE